MLLIALLAGFIAAQTASAAKPQPVVHLDATSIVHDHDDAVPPNQYTFQSDDFNASGQAVYTNTGGVMSTIGDPGGWGLDLYGQSLRTVHLVFKTVDGSTPVVPDGYYWDKVEIYSQCYDPSGVLIPFKTIPVGMSANRCRFAFDFRYNRITYKLAMGQFQLSGPANGTAMVTCNSADATGACNSWTIAPNMGAPNATIANLYMFGRQGLVVVGQYYETFRIDVTLP